MTTLARHLWVLAPDKHFQALPALLGGELAPRSSSWNVVFRVFRLFLLLETLIETQIRPLVQGDPTCHGAPEPVGHSFCSPPSREPALQGEKPPHETPVYHNWRAASIRRGEDPAQPKINEFISKRAIFLPPEFFLVFSALFFPVSK
ncbi:hypothetical protein MJT46_011779 [Ovis ammon polii x Ovis aries]|nr:hypothetical protein MJT46_011779 [Ovis ammon polii x Ovis aries]